MGKPAEHKPVDCVRKVRELLSEPARWTRKLAARKADGSGCDAENPQAVCWCVMGAITKVCSTNTDPAFKLLREGLGLGEFVMIGADWNDDPTMTHERMLAGLDKVIAYAEAQP